jgi:hypothetical protein
MKDRLGNRMELSPSAGKTRYILSQYCVYVCRAFELERDEAAMAITRATEVDGVR